MRIEVVSAALRVEEANAFYASQGRGGTVMPTDTLVIAREMDGIAGIVRLCDERTFFSLRTMQVKRELQRQGLGRLLLKRFEALVIERGIPEIFCMPYAHLELFYGSIGFRRIDEDRAPEVLWNRFDKHRNRRPNGPVILMAR